jgi:hypothetical protein
MTELRFPLLLRLVGVATVLHACFGLLLGLMTLFIITRTDFSQWTEQHFTKTLPDEVHREVEVYNFDVSKLPEIVSSSELEFWVS